MGNRPVEMMATLLTSVLGENLQQVYATTVPDPKAAPCLRVARSFQAEGVASQAIPHPLTALETALSALVPDELLVITGSLYLIGYLRPLILDLLPGRPGRNAGGS